MRLINADSLIENLSKWMKQVDPTHPSDIPPMDDIIVSTIMTVEEEPTIDPVRHGKWIYRDDDFDFYDTYTCSECDGEITVDAERHYDMGMVIEDVLYCPHCGSRNVVETWNVPDWSEK
jgi:DNA-directed RNA polymerase subunit RPC12/RpoP